jgi:hypothetical protein
VRSDCLLDDELELLRRLDELDIALEEVVDEVADVDALGLGALGEVVAGGRLTVIASIEEPELIERILAHRRERDEEDAPTSSLGARAPPQGLLF